MSDPSAHLWYGAAWLAFGALHSLLAALPVKRRLAPWFGAWYRLAYNLFAAVSFAGVWLLGRALLGGQPAFGWTAGGEWALLAVQGLGVAILAGGLRGYDLGRFGGLRQIRNHHAGRSEPEDETLRLDGLHRYVRHPLYLGALLFLWGGATDPLGLATAAWATLYLGIGTVFEERKLLQIYGSAYAEYRVRVPALVPWRGRAL